MKKIKILVLGLMVFLLSVSVINASNIVQIIYDKNDLSTFIDNVSLEVNQEINYLQVYIAGSIKSINWTNEDTSIAMLSGNNLNPHIKAKSEGSTKFKVNVSTQDGSIVNQDLNINVYTKLSNEYGYASTNNVQVKRGASLNAALRGIISYKQDFTIIGKSGNYYYIKMLNNYHFNDNHQGNYGYILKNQVSIPTTSFSINKDTINIKLRGSTIITYNFSPSLANKNNSINWSSSNKGIVSISKNNNSLKINGLKNGYTKITLEMMLNNGTKLKKTVNVSVYTERITSDRPIGYLKKDDYLFLGANSGTKKRIKAKKNLKYNIIGKCGRLYYIKVADSYRFSDGNNDRYAYVYDSVTRIPIVKFNLNTSSLKLRVGNKYNVNLKNVIPNITTDKTEYWSIKDKKIATVNKYGLVTGKSGGTTVVSVKVGSLSKSFKVSVYSKDESMSNFIKASAFTNIYKYGFANSANNFTNNRYRIINSERNKLKANLRNTGENKAQIMNELSVIEGKWHGACYGLSVSAGLNFMKQINVNKYIGNGTKKGYNLNNVGIPKYNLKLESLITYYHALQFYSRLKPSNYFYYPNNYNNYKIGVMKVLDNAKDNKLQIFTMQVCTKNNCSTYFYHTVIVKNYLGKNAKGEFKIAVYDNGYPKLNSYLLIGKDYKYISVLNYGKINNFETSTDFGIFKDFDIDN
ncbi:MAG: Ig-like domain-containing protein [Bacilli bacterium]|jgi:hypothetical protein|nr:Ig-like domain-containing protein [Bacilli bacterium]